MEIYNTDTNTHTYIYVYTNVYILWSYHADTMGIEYNGDISCNTMTYSRGTTGISWARWLLIPGQNFEWPREPVRSVFFWESIVQTNHILFLKDTYNL